MSQRTSRVDELLREEISGIVAREIQDPRIGFVTITDVEVTRDLRHATVWVSVIGDEKARRESLRALSNAMPFVRRRLGELRIKRIPDLHVKHDDAAERGTRLLRILDELSAGGDPDIPPITETLPIPRGRGQGDATQIMDVPEPAAGREPAAARDPAAASEPAPATQPATRRSPAKRQSGATRQSAKRQNVAKRQGTAARPAAPGKRHAQSRKANDVG
ncbi:MAG: ribosome-binding factor [Chloroflexota bacterium]|nr:ribosome-binding factor [Chloroflexota bacterium]